MKKEDLTTKDAGELQQMLQEQRQKLGQLRFDLADKKLKTTSDFQKTRRTIARILTQLRKHATA